MTIYTRLSDGETLDFSLIDSAFDRLIGAHSVAKKIEFGYGEFGESVELAIYVEQKTFSIELSFFSSGRSDEQLEALSFFTKDEAYSLSDQDYELDDLQFYVMSIDVAIGSSGKDVISLTCQAKYGVFVKEREEIFWAMPVTSGANFAGATATFTNVEEKPVSIRLKIKPATAGVVTFKPNINVSLKDTARGGFVTALGATDYYGELSSFNATEIVIDSYSEVIKGQGLINPLNAEFFRVGGLQNSTISIGGITNPFETAQNWVLELVAYSLEQEA